MLEAVMVFSDLEAGDALLGNMQQRCIKPLFEIAPELERATQQRDV